MLFMPRPVVLGRGFRAVEAGGVALTVDFRVAVMGISLRKGVLLLSEDAEARLSFDVPLSFCSGLVALAVCVVETGFLKAVVSLLGTLGGVLAL